MVVRTCCKNRRPSAINLDISGLTYSVSNAFTDAHGPTGTHFHTTNGIGSPPTQDIPNAAEVAGFFGDEEGKGLSEFDISSAPSMATTATLTFRYKDVTIYSAQPIDGVYGQGLYEGLIDVVAYQGTNSETLASYGAAEVSGIGTFDTTGAIVLDEVNFDVTPAYNIFKGLGYTSFGVRLELNPSDVDAGGATFENFVLSINVGGG